MASLEIENNVTVVKNTKKRKSDTVDEKVKKKIKHSEILDMKEETDEVIETVKKKKKHVKVIENNKCSGIVEEQNITAATFTESNVKSKPKKVKELPTVAIAVPGSILDNAQSPEFRTYLAGQIARAACIYKIDEVCFVILFY